MINTELLKDRISAAGYTQKEVAKRIGMSENTFSNIMKTGKCNVVVIDMLCDVLRIHDNDAKVKIFLSQSSHLRDD